MSKNQQSNTACPCPTSTILPPDLHMPFMSDKQCLNYFTFITYCSLTLQYFNR
jgi:hypothetical protein